jgi:serine/threonine protein kinase
MFGSSNEVGKEKTMKARLGVQAESQQPDVHALDGPENEVPESRQHSPTIVTEDQLTPYQRERIVAGCASELTIGPYRILDKLGQGGFGQVFKAEHSLMHRVVALKVIVPERTNAEHWLLREIRAATRLTHPNIALAYDANIIDGVLYFAMEFVDGPDLDTLVAEQGPLPVPFVWALMRQTTLAFQCANEQGIVHRDIKPANLLLVGAAVDKLLSNSWTPSDFAKVVVKVVDFGLARCYPKGNSVALTIEGATGIVGTPTYIAPEQAKNVHDADIRSDLYSLGCSMYCALAGRPPFPGANIAEVLSQHQHMPPKPLDQIRPDAPAALVGIIHRLMAKNPKERFQTPGELLETLAYAQMSCFSRVAAPARDPALLLADEKATGTTACITSAGKIAFAAKELAPPEEALPARKPAQEEVMRLWQEWCNIIEVLAHNGLPQLHTEDYKVLHRTLGLAVRASREAADPTRGDLLARLEVLVEPWLALTTLQALDRPTRMDLWRSCRQIDRELCPRPQSLGLQRLTFAAVGCALLSSLAFFLARFARGWFLP